MGTIDGREALLRGTLDMLILRTLRDEPMHGYGIALQIQRLSRDALKVEEGSLYPALNRLRANGWVTAKWKLTPTNRRARYYTITAAGRQQLGDEIDSFQRVLQAITLVMEGA